MACTLPCKKWRRWADKEVSNSLVQLLREQRNHFLQEFHTAEEGLEVIAEERESELEEHAQEEQSARFLTRLDDTILFAVKEIDAAPTSKKSSIISI